MPEKLNERTDLQLASMKVEALLFAAPGLTSVDQLAQATGLKRKEIEAAWLNLRSITDKCTAFGCRKLKGNIN